MMVGSCSIVFCKSTRLEKTMKNVRNRQYLTLCSVFVLALGASAGTCKWKGDPAVGYWDDEANWENGSVPQEGDDVVINTWKKANISVTITNTTPLLKSLQVGGTYASTLVTTNWNTCIRAETVTIGTRAL